MFQIRKNGIVESQGRSFRAAVDRFPGNIHTVGVEVWYGRAGDIKRLAAFQVEQLIDDATADE